MDLPDSQTKGTPQRTRSERPPPCPRCTGACWWNGWRQVFPHLEQGRAETWLPRARCKSGCADFTVRPPALYPRRQYQLDVVSDVVAAVAVGGETPATAAARATASTTSARRWTAWVAKLADVGQLLALAQHLDPDAAPGAGLSTAPPTTSTRTLAARILHALEHLGAALLRSGVALVSKSGLGRVLEWQHAAHGDVYGLVAGIRRFSPAMALGGLDGDS